MRRTRRSRTVLVVEDDDGLRELYRQSLSAAGYAVVAVGDGLDALRHIDGGSQPSAVLLDSGLPRVSGLDVAQELRAHADTMDIPIVVVTASDGNFDEHDFACVLKKPVNPEQLLAAVEACLRRAQRR